MNNNIISNLSLPLMGEMEGAFSLPIMGETEGV